MKRSRRYGSGVVGSFGQVLIMVLLVVAAGALYAPLKDHLALRDDLIAARERQAELEVLYPLYAEISTLSTPEDWSAMPPPASASLLEPELVAIPARFTELARACALELAALRPRVEQQTEGSRYLRVDLIALGAYGQLKDFLTRMVQMPELRSIEKIEVRNEGRQERFHVIANLALQGGEG